jgi:hypothetical protein
MSLMLATSDLLLITQYYCRYHGAEDTHSLTPQHHRIGIDGPTHPLKGGIAASNARLLAVKRYPLHRF